MNDPSNFHERLSATGVRCTTGAENVLADDFGDLAGESAALHTAVGIVDFSTRTQVEFRGRDRARFLHNLCTNDIKQLAPGQGCEAFLTNPQGKILGFVHCFAGADSLILETVPGQGEFLGKYFNKFLFREDVQILDRSQDWAELLVAGPRCEELLAGCLAETLPTRALQHGPAALRDAGGQACDVWVRRVDLTRGGGFLIAMPRGELARARQLLTSAGARPCGAAAWNAARIEHGTPLYGDDIGDDNLPQEVDRDERAISFKKGCYIGQETVARIDAMGHVNWLLRVLEIPGDAPPLGLTWTAEGKSIARLTSAAFSPGRNGYVGLAYVRRGQHAVGSILREPRPATVIAPV